MFHNYNVFGSCIIHILYTGCAKIKRSNSGAKRLDKQVTSSVHAAVAKADDRCTPLHFVRAIANELPTDEEYNNKVKRQWSHKALHGRHPHDLSQQYVDIGASNKRLTNTKLFVETEGFLTAIQHQVILTRNYKKYILKQPDTYELCRRCGKESETIQHITAACEQLAPTEYVKRHDGLAKIIQQLAEAVKFIDNKSPYYKYTPANVLENENFKLYWNRSVLTDKTVPFNRPDITFMNKKKHIFDRHSCPKYTKSRQNNKRRTKQVPRTGE